MTTARFAVAEAFRREWGGVVAHLIRVTGNWDLAEECAQDAFTKALETWTREGVPANPAGWLKTTARNRAYDRLRRERVGQAKIEQVAKSIDTAEQDDTGNSDGSPTIACGCSSRAAIRRCRGGASCARPAHPSRTDDSRDRSRLPRSRGDNGQAARSGQTQDP